MDTKQAILDQALELFNRQGVAAVSTNHVAQAMKISPGNLYYHYRNKAEIIRALAEQLFAAYAQELSPLASRVPSLENLQDLARAHFRVIWTYRFLYREQVALLRQDELLMTRWMPLRQSVFERFRALFDAYVEAGLLTGAAGPAAVDETAETCLLIAGYWLAAVETAGREVDEAAFEQGTRLLLRALRVRRFRVGGDGAAD